MNRPRDRLVGRVVAGALGGAVGTLALDASTHADMALRGRPPSSVPEDSIQRSAQRMGLSPLARDDERARNRRQGLGALSGSAIGVGVGALYVLLRGLHHRPSRTEPLVVAAIAMVGGNAGAIASGSTDPRRWTVTDWLADIVPHLCYGLAATTTWRLLRRCEVVT